MKNDISEEFKLKEMDPLFRQGVAGTLLTILEDDWYAGDPAKKNICNVIREKLQEADDMDPNTEADKALAEAVEMILENKVIDDPDDLKDLVKRMKHDYGVD